MAARQGLTRQSLARLLGDEAFRRLVSHYGGRVVRIPRSPKPRRIVPASKITSVLDAGDSYRRAARRLGVGVATIVRKAKSIV